MGFYCFDSENLKTTYLYYSFAIIAIINTLGARQVFQPNMRTNSVFSQYVVILLYFISRYI